MMPIDKYLNILKQYWGYDSFRGIQREIIESIGSGKDTLGLMPTGGGKSITFQVPALAQEGVCIVITPLIALMKDQVQNLRRLGIMAAAIYSGMSHDEILTTLENAVLGSTKLLYVSPERLSSELFQAKLRHMNVNFITVDEAHCISQWGYDFRPAYLQIAKIRKVLSDHYRQVGIQKSTPPVLALTATATTNVVDDIQEQLSFRQKNVFKMSFERKNLVYVVRRTEDKSGELMHILNSVAGSAIVYVRSRKRSKEIATLLNENGYSATYFHAGLEPAVKDDHQQRWTDGEIRVIVATNAFGMGIDKADVRLVLHIDCPDSIEAYFQEAGRAGRDGKKAYAVLLYNGNDRRKLKKRVVDNFPPKEYIKQVYEDLGSYFQMAVGDGYGVTKNFHIDEFCTNFKHFSLTVDSSLKLLERAGYIHYETSPDDAARVMFLLERDQLYMLENLSREEDSIVTTLLRSYGGLFSDYVYIDETHIAKQNRIDEQKVYQYLKSLSQRRIIHFIPKRSIPYITYLQRRERTDLVVLSKEVYEDRRECYEKRIKAMLEYAECSDVCRSRWLLAYFGEKRSTDCMHCDICLDHHTDQHSEKRLETARQMILDILSDKQPHAVSELLSIQLPRNQVDGALSYLLSEEIVSVVDGVNLIIE